MSEYDKRQYQRMVDQIRDFESKRVDLKHIINGLDALLSALEQADAGWKSEFQRNWGVLEEVICSRARQKKTISYG
jgi:hypothetical protein